MSPCHVWASLLAALTGCWGRGTASGGVSLGVPRCPCGHRGTPDLSATSGFVASGAPSLVCPQIIEGQPPERVSLVGAGDTLAVIRLMAPVVPVGTGGLVVPVRLSEPADPLRVCFVFNVFIFGCTQHRGLPLIADLDGPAYEYTIWEACRARPATGLVFRMALNPAVAGRY